MKVKPLNNVDHKDLTVDTRAMAEYGDLTNRAIVVTTEFAELHKHFPILIFKDPESGESAAHAIMGFENGENLFVRDKQWTTPHIPAALARGPFMYAPRNREEDGQEVRENVILVEEDHPRCNAPDGQPVFLEYGGESPYLQFIRKILKAIELGMHAEKFFLQLLEQHELIEPLAIQVTLDSENQIRFDNYYSINQEKLASLSGDALHSINSTGFMAPIYYLISSLSNFNQMITLKNALKAET